ncbi:hypothetical protein [Agromyces sp. SYSU T00194]|uniref:hypothetical protein n=1 Tax=Agromyces chitinivorans TaxID=3158560 RepID=UPI00339ACDBA
MSDAVALSLIAASAGVLGALLGAAGAVFGPWWLSRAQHDRDLERERREALRLAVVEWVNAHIDMANRMDKGESPGEAAGRMNRALTEISSRLVPGDRPVETWVHGTGAYSSAAASAGLRRRAYGSAGRMLLAWNRGEVKAGELRPFHLVYSADGRQAGTTSIGRWPTTDELRAMSAAVAGEVVGMPDESAAGAADA